MTKLFEFAYQASSRPPSQHPCAAGSPSQAVGAPIGQYLHTSILVHPGLSRTTCPQSIPDRRQVWISTPVVQYPADRPTFHHWLNSKASKETIGGTGAERGGIAPTETELSSRDTSHLALSGESEGVRQTRGHETYLSNRKRLLDRDVSTTGDKRYLQVYAILTALWHRVSAGRTFIGRGLRPPS